MFHNKDKATIRKQAESILSSQKSQHIEKLSLHETQKILHELEVHQVELEMQNEDLRTIYEELEKTKRRYFDLYDMAPIGYCTLTHNGLIEDVNLAMSDLLLQDRSKLIKQPFTRFIDSQDQDTYYMFRQRILTSQEKQECELKIIKEDKTACWVSLSAIEELNITRLVIKDISERKDIEKKLKENEEIMLAQSKQAAMGEMISMIAHQWRQPLNVISLSLGNLNFATELGEDITKGALLKHTSTVSTQLNQLSQTIDDFRNFFKPDQVKDKITIQDLLDSTLSIIGTSLKNAKINVDIQNNSKSSLLLNKTSLIQVLLNIIGNAKDILLEKQVSEANINIKVEEDKESIKILICDNAGGIPESIIHKLGQPYFSTKKNLNGTGLGLHICHMIMDKHLSGSLRWYNVSKGACFEIMLNLENTN